MRDKWKIIYQTDMDGKFFMMDHVILANLKMDFVKVMEYVYFKIDLYTKENLKIVYQMAKANRFRYQEKVLKENLNMVK